MSVRSVPLLLLVTACACASEPVATPAEAQAEPAETRLELPEDFARDVEAYVDGWGRQWPTFKVHGHTAVFVDGQPAFDRAWGLRDLATEAEHTTGDAFEIGTLSVHLTQATTLALVRDGTLALDEAAAHYIDLPIQPSVTIEHLLSMTSGLPNFTESLMFERVYKRRPASHAALVASFAGDPLEFEPGSDFAPSLSNAAVLGLVIESVTGDDYADVVAQKVLRPLHMADTRYGRVEGASVGLSFNEAEYLDPVLDADPASLGAAGAWTSTAADLGRLYAAMLGAHFGARLSRRVWGDNALGQPYGFVPRLVGGREAFAWIGRFDGHEHGVFVVPEDGLVVLHLANSEVAPGSDIAEAVASMAYALPVSVRQEARPVPLDPAPLAAFAGRWVLRPSDLAFVEETADEDTLAALRSVETTFEDTKGLSLHIQGRPAKRMHPTAPRSFFFKDRPQSTARIAGTKDAPLLVLERGGGALHYRRLTTPGA
ncbi:MAG: serine hydrolase domain-containing protein [Nannocystaceae bacterium]|nr:beta-lactamase family protein [bacterium]